MTETTLIEKPASAKGAVDPFWYAQGDPWMLEQDRWDPERSIYFETIFSLANGYMGFRGYREEMDNVNPALREGYMAGVFAKLPPVARKLVIHDYEWDSLQMVALPAIFTALVTLDGETFSLLDGELSLYRQSLDMRTGMHVREVEWNTDRGRITRLRFTRFLSAATPNLAVHRIDIEPVNWSGKVEVCWDYDLAEKTIFRCGDPAKAHVPCPHFYVVDATAGGDKAGGLVATSGTGHRIAITSRVEAKQVSSFGECNGLISQLACEEATEGSVSSFVRYTTVSCTRDKGVTDPVRMGSEILDRVSGMGYDQVVAEHTGVWSRRWKASDIELDGPARDQALIRYGVYNLLQMAPFHASNLSVPARCYAYNRYNGLYFWDSEIFLLPFYQFCAPDAARNMLQFRCGTLEGAKRNAAMLGGKGAIFPWQGDADFGEEQAPWGLYEYLWHQNADIIYAFDQYARATGDEAFMCGHGLEVLAETARFWCSKLQSGRDGFFHLENTVGPDEAEEHGVDNGYTGLMAQRSLEISHRWWQLAKEKHVPLAQAFAAKLELSDDELAEWRRVAARICIPEVPGCPGVPLQDACLLKRKREDISTMTVAEFWKRRGEVQVIKQADIVLAMYLLEDSFTREDIKRGYEFYEPRTLHVSSLSYNTHSIVAAIIGHKEEAYEYFHRAAGLDLDNIRNATKDGLHAAALGGVWQMALAGFMGLRVREDHLFLQPALPVEWEEIRFPLQYRGWKLKVTAGKGRYLIEVSGSGQPESVVKIGDKSFTLAKGSLIKGQI